MRRPGRGGQPKDVGERLFAAAFASLQGKPATTESFREIASAAVRCALLWVDALVQLTGPLDDAALADLIRDIAVEQLADIRATGDRINFRAPRDRLN